MLQAVWKRKEVIEQQERAWVPGIAKKSFQEGGRTWAGFENWERTA